ncbi:MAG TPA: lanthionine synthetase LanC family protein [Nitrolancea sp.]
MGNRVPDAYRAQLETLIGALRVGLPDRHRWFGEWSRSAPKDVAPRIDPETRRRLLIAHVQSRLYRQFYLTGGATPDPHAATPLPAPNENPFVHSFAEANRGTGTWQSGWVVVERSEAGVWAERDGLTVWLEPGEYRNAMGLPATANGAISVLLPKDLPSRSPGFYLAQSDEPFQPSPGDVLVRLYWHLAAAGARLLIASATSRLNAERVPFNVKVLNDPSAYHRYDAGVLYITRQDLIRTSHLLAKVYEDVHHALQPGVPALTKPLAAGLGLAEDPGTGESFGLHRCRLLAEALVEAAEQQIVNPPDLLDAVEDHLRHAGIDPAHPYLRTNSVDDYDELLNLEPLPIVVTAHDQLPIDEVDCSESFRAVAQKIGDRLVREAIWHDDRCTWLGSLEAQPAGRGATFGAIGPDVYDGTSGIALFLAQLYAETGIGSYRTAALGAMRQGVRLVDQIDAPRSLGFHTGWPGIAATAAQVGILLDDRELTEEIPVRLTGRLVNVTQHRVPDLLAGTAGTVVALLALWRTLGDERLLARAVSAGDQLLVTARRQGTALCWPVNSRSGRRALTGLAHGAAGISFALLDLFRATRDERFRHAAEAALSFERRNFNPALQNWLDLRFPVEGSRLGPAAIASSVWCHGSGGIAISRLTAWDVLGEPVYRAEARTALRATSGWTEQQLERSERNWSLCHGLAGNATILWWAAPRLSDQAATLKRLALRVSAAGLATVEKTGEPSALDATDEPGLMLGLAGIGHFYLVLSNPAIPSVLVPGASSPQLEI